MKTNHFFIAGAPRSATGWSAAFLTTDDSVCLHEGLKFVGTKQYRELFGALGKRYSGDSGAHIPFIFEELRIEFPKAKFVIIRRDEQDAMKAAFKLGMRPADSYATFRAMDHMKGEVGCLEIPFKSVFTANGARALWEYCLPDKEFDVVRFNVFRRLNIQATADSHKETLDYVKSGVERSFHQV